MTASPERALHGLVDGLLRATEDSAVAAAAWRGRGDEKAADQAAVDAMRERLRQLPMAGTVVIGEGERDSAPMLYVGEAVGDGTGPDVDIAVDPLEGTTICATDSPGALAVLAAGGRGDLLRAPDVYMEKLAVGPGCPDDLLRLDRPPADNLGRIADAKGCRIDDLTVCILRRERHDTLIRAVRASGARLRLIGDGDVAAVIQVADHASPVDVYMGTGGAPEGVLAAAALACTGGAMQARLVFRDEDERARASRAGIRDLERVYDRQDLASGNTLLIATGVTDGPLVEGPVRAGTGVTCDSLVFAADGRRERRRSTVPLSR